MRLAQLVHGYPPRENAGTEQYARRVAEGLRRRGWEVLTIAAAPRPGARMYEVTEEPGLLRIVNNAPYAGLRRACSDPAVDRIAGDALARFRPDVVHVQHLQNLSATVPLPYAVVWTLHDAWAWCAAGGLLLRDGAPCDGPGPACAACASAWTRDPPVVERALTLAGHLSRFVGPDRLHAAWRRAPAGLRARVLARPSEPLAASQIEARSRALRALPYTLVSPSRWLAREAVRNGLAEPLVLPHGVDPSPLPRTGTGPYLFLGTLAPHKGPRIVAEAARLAGVPVDIHGPDGPDAAVGAGPVPQADVPRRLSHARALVLGSIWPENAPLVVLEARAAGCPVLAPAIGGLPEIVDPAGLYPPGDIAALAALMRRAPPPVAPPPTFSEHLDALCRVYKRAQEDPRR